MPEEEPKKKRMTKKNIDEGVKKPSVEDISEEVILPWDGPEAIPVNHMEPIESAEPEKTAETAEKGKPFRIPSGDMRPIQIDEQRRPPRDSGCKTGVRETPSDSARERAAAKAAANKSEGPSEMEKMETAEDIEAALEQKPEYVFPPLDILVRGQKNKNSNTDEHLRQTAMKLKTTLESFGVKVQITNVSCGPTVTRYELQPEQGVKVSKILSLSDDIKLNLAVADIRIEAPIPGKAAIGIEVPNKENTTVTLRELLESREFQNSKSDIAFAAGRDIGGKVILADIAKMPHLLIAGATGSGKSVWYQYIDNEYYL